MNSSLVIAVAALFLVCSPLLANGRRHGVGQASLVNDICMNLLQDKENCVTILKAADPKIAEAKSYKELALAVLDFGVGKGTEAQTFLKGLAAMSNSPAIKQCANFFYDGVAGGFKVAMMELDEDPQTASYDAKTIMDGPDGCNRALAAENISNPAIAALNQEISLLSMVAFNAICKYSN